MGKNNFFRFKQFKVQQSNTAMKVGTDGILLGAWVNVEDCDRILDVGTGTGLIALMLAQRSKAKISAIEIESDAALQAKENIAASPWQDRIGLKHISLQDFANVCAEKFDLIVSNPPFFKQSLKAKSKARTLARHTDSLPFDELIKCAANLLAKNGRLALVLPIGERDHIKRLAGESGLSVLHETFVKPKSSKAANRILLEFAKGKENDLRDELSIYTGDGSAYSDEFRTLTSDFYLAH